MRRLFLVSFVVAAFAHPGSAAIIHVLPGGDIQGGIDGATDGDTVLVAPGTYQIVLDLRIEGTPTAPRSLTLISEGGPEVTTIAPAGAGTTNGILVDYAEDVTICGFEIAHFNQIGIRIWRSNNITIRDNIIHNNPSAGIDMNPSGPFLATNVLVKNNTVTDCGNGVGVPHASVIIDHNVVWGNTNGDIVGGGIQNCNLLSEPGSQPQNNIVEIDDPFCGGFVLCTTTRPGCGELGAGLVGCTAPTIELTSPNGGETWIAGDIYQITWTSTGALDPNVDIWLSSTAGSTWDSLTTVPNNGTHTLWAPIDLGDATLLKIRGRSGVTSYEDVSNATFTIDPPAGTIGDGFATFSDQWEMPTWPGVCGYELNQDDYVQHKPQERTIEIEIPSLSEQIADPAGHLATQTRHHYGWYGVRMKAASGAGPVTAFFTFDRECFSPEGEQHEIDVELYGERNNEVDFVAYVQGRRPGDPECPSHAWTRVKLDNVDLGFDTGAAFYDYAFYWRENQISFFVDWQWVGSIDASHPNFGGLFPRRPSRVIIEGWRYGGDCCVLPDCEGSMHSAGGTAIFKSVFFPPPANTFVGRFVKVQPDPQVGVTVSFDEVTADGTTTLALAPSGPVLPTNIQVSTDPPQYYDIQTTSTFTSEIEVCVTYDEGALNVDENFIRLLYHDGAVWRDVTTRLMWPTNEICGTVSSLSPFVVAWDSTTTSDAGDFVPTAVRLYRNAPNPFNPMTEIRYYIPRPTSVDLRVYDVAGRLVRVLEQSSGQSAGQHQVMWDGHDSAGRSVASGIYLLELTTEFSSLTRKMVVAR